MPGDDTVVVTTMIAGQSGGVPFCASAAPAK
jgi:hypothetical protein